MHMATKSSQPTTPDASKVTPVPLPSINIPPPIASAVEQNVMPVVNEAQRVATEAQRVAAETSVSGRTAVSRGTILLIFYLWLLSGAVIASLLAGRTELFPGDKSITRT